MNYEIITEKENKAWIADLTLNKNNKLDWKFIKPCFTDTTIGDGKQKLAFTIYESRFYCFQIGEDRCFYVIKNGKLEETTEAKIKSTLKKQGK